MAYFAMTLRAHGVETLQTPLKRSPQTVVGVTFTSKFAQKSADCLFKRSLNKAS